MDGVFGSVLFYKVSNFLLCKKVSVNTVICNVTYNGTYNSKCPSMDVHGMREDFLKNSMEVFTLEFQ